MLQVNCQKWSGDLTELGGSCAADLQCFTGMMYRKKSRNGRGRSLFCQFFCQKIGFLGFC
ncbi:hypothetical protein DBR43_32165 [Pedobacter sp. KBW06]|nr:hypothetical protein DBR43_32165 [Pedobacter sp. KBW06]